MEYKILERDAALLPYAADIELRMKRYAEKRRELLKTAGTLCDFANGHEYFGFHKTADGWVYREWAPAAEAVYLTGDMVGWEKTRLALSDLGDGVYEIFLKGKDALWDGCHVQTLILRQGRLLERIPLYIRRVEQDRETFAWCGVITDEPAYTWKHSAPKKPKAPRIYECHIGMAQDKEGIGTYEEFIRNVLPRVRSLGYDTLQIMAVMEHPYYGSFGYQVSSFFAACSRYGTPNGLKALVDEAHGMGLTVLLDVVHSHAVNNTAEGINEFDGTSYQFFHEGARGDHPAWGTKLFNYGKNGVIHFLLSNLKFWMTEYRFDGFRFDGVTSMIYRNHGLGVSFGDYDKYFSDNTDAEAVTYLQLANALIREVNTEALTVAEDMSAMPGMCLPLEEGGIGFDYRLAMGTPDMWIRLLEERADEAWDMWQIYGELTSRRQGEKYIAYAESHDQALVGDKTIMFRLCDSKMYTAMAKWITDPVVERGMALHKLIRLATATLGGEGYLNFMGNEFGHPEWIDFPREGNGWSYLYCRRQWHLAEDKNLKYQFLENFDRALMTLLRDGEVYEEAPRCATVDADKKVLVYERGGLTFALNFHPTDSYEGYCASVPEEGQYRVILSTDSEAVGGWGRISETYVYRAEKGEKDTLLVPIYLPARTGLVLKKQ